MQPKDSKTIITQEINKVDLPASHILALVSVTAAVQVKTMSRPIYFQSIKCCNKMLCRFAAFIDFQDKLIALHIQTFDCSPNRQYIGLHWARSFHLQDEVCKFGEYEDCIFFTIEKKSALGCIKKDV